MPRNLKARLKNGDTLVGPLVTLPSPDVAEILSLVGFDYLWIETEHAPADVLHAQTMIQAVGGRCPCLVRIPENKEVWIKKALDVGCDGIVVPQVRSAVEVEAVIEWSLYPPAGKRSVGVSRAHDYGMAFQEYIETANDELAIVIQAEHADAVQNIKSIVAVPGIDAVLIGPFDLSGSLGVLGQITHPRVQEAIAEIKHHCDEAGVPAGIFSVNAESAKDYIDQGFNLIALSMDSVFLWESAKAALGTVRAEAE
jgi:2-dehydro-3-deoxyglucarate aldolase/4-hydroxy-2-oxoheptanedioate aldolase